MGILTRDWIRPIFVWSQRRKDREKWRNSDLLAYVTSVTRSSRNCYLKDSREFSLSWFQRLNLPLWHDGWSQIIFYLRKRTSTPFGQTLELEKNLWPLRRTWAKHTTWWNGVLSELWCYAWGLQRRWLISLCFVLHQFPIKWSLMENPGVELYPREVWGRGIHYPHSFSFCALKLWSPSLKERRMSSAS